MSFSRGFFRLPAELRANVYEELKLDTLEHEDHSHFKSYVQVCREWQLVFEECTFRRVVLNQYNLAKFDALVCQDERRRAFVREIVLMVKFPAYDHLYYNRKEDVQIAFDNDKTFMMALRDFLRIMSTWEPVTEEGIAFELGGYSPSDKYHRNHEKDISITRGPVVTKENEQYIPSKCSACHRSRAIIMDSPLHFGPFTWFQTRVAEFQPVKAITSLAVCRSTTRIVSPTILNPLMWRGLPELRTYRHETWQSRTRKDRRGFHMSYSHLFNAGLPRKTESVHLLSETTTGCFPDAFPSMTMTHNVESRMLGALWLTSAAENLRVFSAPYMVDARNFLLGVRPGMPAPDRYFPRLERLNLTFSAFPRAEGREQRAPISHFIEDLIGPVLETMPKLRLMELWSLDKTQCAVFRYRRRGDVATIHYRSSRENDPTFEDEAFDAWAQALESRCRPRS